MRKILSMLLALSMMLAMLAACNNEPVDPVKNPDDQQQEENQGNEDNEMVSDVLNLVFDGVSDYVIVRGENAYISEVTASTELQKYLKQISGVEIPIVTDATAPVEKEIVVGKTNREADGEFDREELGDDGLVIKTNGKKLFLVGGEQRGTLYAVYTFLEEYLGCGFYTADVEIVPEMKTVSLEKIEEDKQIPVFDNRAVIWYSYTSGGSIYSKRKLNYCAALTKEVGGQSIRYLNSGHSMNYYVSVEDYFAEHPEYFSMNSKGNRVSDQQHCFTNSEVLDIVINEVRKSLGSDHDVKGIMQIQQRDADGACLCENCKAVYEEEGGAYSATVLRFVNAVATALKDEYPNVRFQTYAYMFSRSAPTKTVPADNVDIMLCSIECCYSHPIDSDCIATNRATYLDGSHNSFIEDLTAWGKITEHVSIYDYITNFAHWAQTFPNFDVMWENARIYAENNVNELYPLGNYAGQDVEFGDLRCYLLSKLLWDPYMSKEEYSDLMDEFLANVYGPGWENIRAYIDLAEELSSENHFGIYNSADVIYGWPGAVELNPKDSYPGDLTVDMIRNYESVDWTQYNNWFKDYEGEPTIISEGERLFKAAMALAETDEQKTALDKAYCQVEYIRLVYEYLRISVGSGSIGKILTNFMAQHPDDFTSDEKRELRVAIIQFANGHYYDTYAQHCSDFVEKIKSYGVTSLREGTTINSNLDFTELPEDWYD